MAKELLKRSLGAKKGKEKLDDTDRLLEKARGGTYTDGNVVLADPVAHMARHGNLRLRSEALEELKAIIDDREQFQKLFNKINNQLLAYARRTDHGNAITMAFLEKELEPVAVELAGRTKLLTRWVNKHKKEDALMLSALGVKSIGPVTVAYCAAYIDMEKADHPSSLWAYVGYDKPAHQRYTKGVKGGGNKRLRTALYNTASSCMKSDGPYREVYDRVKTRLENSESVVESFNTEGMKVKVMWKDTKPSHRHGAALRAIAKHFLADYWFVGRTLMGLSVNDLYVKAHLGHQSAIIDPKSRGWIY